MNSSDLEIIISHVCGIIGLDPDSVGFQSVKKASESYIASKGIKGLSEFFNGSEDHPNLLGKKLLVPETWFFRDNEPFSYLKTIIQERRNTGLFRILSAPCATGEEPYSIALTLIESPGPVCFRIDAVDINSEFIETAKAGVFTPNSFRTGFPSAYTKYFMSDINKTSRIHPRLSAHINFMVMNLLDDNIESKLSQYDAVFCRNLLIYLTRPAREKLLSSIKKLLKPDGILFAGHAEIPFFVQNGFVPVSNSKAFACRPAEVSANSANARNTIEAFRKSAVNFSTNRTQYKTTAVTDFRSTASELKKATVKVEPPFIKSPVKTKTIAEINEMADRGNLAEAEKECLRFLSEHEFSIDALSLMGKIRHALNDETGALSFFNKAIYLNPNHYDSLVYLSLIYKKLGEAAKSDIFRTRADKAREIR